MGPGRLMAARRYHRTGGRLMAARIDRTSEVRVLGHRVVIDPFLLPLTMTTISTRTGALWPIVLARQASRRSATWPWSSIGPPLSTGWCGRGDGADRGRAGRTPRRQRVRAHGPTGRNCRVSVTAADRQLPRRHELTVDLNAAKLSQVRRRSWAPQSSSAARSHARDTDTARSPAASASASGTSGSSSRGDATTMTAHRARDVATFSRLRL